MTQLKCVMVEEKHFKLTYFLKKEKVKENQVHFFKRFTCISERTDIPRSPNLFCSKSHSMLWTIAIKCITYII